MGTVDDRHCVYSTYMCVCICVCERECVHACQQLSGGNCLKEWIITDCHALTQMSWCWWMYQGGVNTKYLFFFFLKLDKCIPNYDAVQAQIKKHHHTSYNSPSVGYCGFLQVDIADWENTLWTEKKAQICYWVGQDHILNPPAICNQNIQYCVIR